MKKRIPKNIKTYTGDEVNRYLGVVHEEHMGALKTIGERFDGVDRKLTEHDKEFDNIGGRFDGIDRKLAEHDKRFDSHTEMIAKIMQNVEILKGDMDIVKSGLKQKPDYKEFMLLQRRVRVLESKVK